MTREELFQSYLRRTREYDKTTPTKQLRRDWFSRVRRIIDCGRPLEFIEADIHHVRPRYGGSLPG